jgi:hypothetical protein
MKKLITFGSICASAVAGSQTNLVKNGNFAENFIPGPGRWTISKTLPGWEIPHEVEQGYGSIYNPNWGNTIVVELDGNVNDVLRQKFDLKEGQVTLELQYAARSGSVATSEMSISWNGQKVKYIKGEDESIHTLLLPLAAVQGTNVLEIAGEGKIDGLGMTVANVKLIESQERKENTKIQTQTGSNLVKNGNFAENFIPGPGRWTISKTLPGWEIPHEVEQGYGSIYNPNWGNTIVVELDGNVNDVLRQKFDLKEGQVTLELQYAARSGSVATSEMSISWNGQKVKYIKGEDESIHTLLLPLAAVQGTNVLEIAGEGKIDGLGMTVANVKLIESQERKENTKIQTQTGSNLVKNGNFAENFIPGPGRWTISKTLPGWEIPHEVEQGYGSIYNPNWGNTIVVELDGNVNDVLRQKFDLKEGQVTLELQYAARSGSVATSEMSISWNGQKVKYIKGEDESIHTLLLPLAAVQGTNVLEIAGEGKIDGLGMTVANVQLTTSLPDSKSNLVSNGYFENPVKTEGREWITSLPGWKVNKVHHGVGYLWNKKWGNRNVIELSDNQNDTLIQTVVLNEGLYKF